MNELEREFEIRRLHQTIEEIKTQLEATDEDCTQTRQTLSSVMRDYWQAGASSSDEAQLLDTMHRQRSLSTLVHRKSAQLSKMLASPYFGRIDFLENASAGTDQVYIGIGSLIHQQTGDFLVYDWRAPISSMFYDYGRGEASYDCPAGTITGRITLKRQFKISDGQMEYMFDADWKIDDSILQNLLSKSADDKMHTIVNSIQREQNQIIRDEKHRALFVKGPAGSGKTSVALHRVAFLLYKDREKLTSQNVLILSPNHIFSDYISNVLPEIGEDNVSQMTFQDFIDFSAAGLPFRFETRAAFLEAMLADRTDPRRSANITYKSSPRFEAALEKYLEQIQSHWVDRYPAIEARGKTIFTRDDWHYYYYDSFSSMPPAVRLEKIRTLLQLRMRPLVDEVRQEKKAELVAAAEEINPKVINALARIHAYEELRPVTDLIERLTTLNAAAEYKRLFAESKLPDSQYLLVRLAEGILPFEDVPAFLYFQGVLQGFPARSELRHIVIDEAQDYTALQYKTLARLFPNCSWTIVGDPVQAIQPFLQTAAFDEASKILDLADPALFTLTKSYRSTKEIQSFCQALLPQADHLPAVNRPGPRPSVIKLPVKAALPRQLCNAIQSAASEGWHSIGIICKNALRAEAVFNSIRESTDAALVTKEEDDFHRGTVVMPSYLAKGLEFDTVLVVDADNAHYHTGYDRHLLYTICTRALHRLELFYSGEISPFITAIPEELYCRK